MSTDTTYTVNSMSGGAIAALSIGGLILAIVFFIAYIQIIRRAGYSGWWVLVLIVPLLNIVMLLIFAYKEWPIQRELRELRGWAEQIQRNQGPPTQGSEEFGAAAAHRPYAPARRRADPTPVAVIEAAGSQKWLCRGRSRRATATTDPTHR